MKKRIQTGADVHLWFTQPFPKQETQTSNTKAHTRCSRSLTTTSCWVLNVRYFLFLALVGFLFLLPAHTYGQSFQELVARTLSDSLAGSSLIVNSVSIHGNAAIVGAEEIIYSSSALFRRGVAYIFRRGADGIWVQETKLTASDGAAGDGFGNNVSIHGDMAIVGALRNDNEKGENAGAAYIFRRSAERVWLQEVKLTALDWQSGEHFGISVSIDRDVALVRNSYNSNYIFRRSADGRWTQEAKLTAPDGAARDWFGTSVAIHGEVAIVGAPYDYNEKGSFAGAAYVFRRGTDGRWVQEVKLTASDAAAGDWFGTSVAIHGEVAMVGARFDDNENGDYAGAAYLFRRSADGRWVQAAKLTAPDGEAGDRFGVSVSIHGDMAIVGADRDDNEKGAAYVFRRGEIGEVELWTQEAKLTALDGKADIYFGGSVSIHGEVAIVGAYGDHSRKGAAFTFHRALDGTWVQKERLTPSILVRNRFGQSVSLYGEVALVGAPGNDYKGENAGAAYLFLRDQGGSNHWGQVATLTASDGAAGDYFGNSVSIDRDVAIVGADGDDNDKGAAYLFRRSLDGTWVQKSKLTAPDGEAGDYFGYSVSIHGDMAIVGADGDDNEKGAAYLFLRDQGGIDTWGLVAKLTAPDRVKRDGFGVSVSLRGNVVIVGAHRDNEKGSSAGAAYIFRRGLDGTWVQEAKLTASDGATSNYFGNSVSLQGDAAIVGAPKFFLNNEKGVAYVFRRGLDGTWAQVAKLTAPEVESRDRFGTSVAIHGDVAMVGARWDDNENGDYAGAAYIYWRDEGGANAWGQVGGALTASDGAANDFFGTSVAIDNDYDMALVGAPSADNYSGAAYFYHTGLTQYKMRNRPANTERPSGFALEQNYPNPFNPTTAIRYAVPQDGLVKLEVFDLLGRKVAELVNERQQAKHYTVDFDASALSSGVYVYRLQAGHSVLTRKMTLIK